MKTAWGKKEDVKVLHTEIALTMKQNKNQKECKF